MKASEGFRYNPKTGMEEPVSKIKEKENDVVNHPSHYCQDGSMECIDEMITVFGEEAVMWFCLCNVWKYRKRALFKNGKEDLKKSDWYMKKYKELKENSTIALKNMVINSKPYLSPTLYPSGWDDAITTSCNKNN